MVDAIKRMRYHCWWCASSQPSSSTLVIIVYHRIRAALAARSSCSALVTRALSGRHIGGGAASCARMAPYSAAQTSGAAYHLWFSSLKT